MKKIAIIGAGPAGIEAASILAKNYEVLLFEKSSVALPNVLDKAFLFPDFSNANDIVDSLNTKLINDNIKFMPNKEIVDVVKNEEEWKVVDKDGKNYFVSAVLMTTGYQVFDAKRKEELGYGIYKGVINSLDMERMIRYNQIVNSINEAPERVVFLQCVGSRDEKSGNRYCSKVCCVTA
ncbi:MAG: CoB--CoM heterodisulfide reductase iron-sulfur subunit A family protein, partial [Bacteroidales bacterium]|nr:CoB--CoM heterodisulfide reductase iron-sulfur subunit A family protein [Bacteroidales bacterium]